MIRLTPHTLLVCLALAAAAASTTAMPACAAPTLGFREDFPASGGLAGWVGGATLSNPGSGGLDRAGDGYLLVARSFSGNLGTNATTSPYSGDWTAAGITQIRLWLSDPNTFDNLEIHVSIGNQGNLWQYNTGFVPPGGAWSEFVVDLTSSAGFTQTIGTGTFSDALKFADRILVRHDHAPFTQNPDPAIGDFGIDHVLLTNGVVGVGDAPAPATAALALAAFPNPARGPVTLSLAAPLPESVRLEVLDAAGRMVRVAALPAGARQWTWDGRDTHGALTAPGVYRVRALTAAGGVTRRFVRVQ